MARERLRERMREENARREREIRREEYFQRIYNDTHSYNRYTFETKPTYDSFDVYNREQSRSSADHSCSCCQPQSKAIDFNIFERKKNSVTVKFTPPPTTEAKKQPPKNQASTTSNRPSSSGQGAAAAKPAAQQNATPAPNASSSGAQQPQRNNNNNNNNNINNNKAIVKDYGKKLNDFIKKLKIAFNRCKASPELREKILAFFDDFEKHEENFQRLLKDYRVLSIEIEDIMTIVVGLFQLDYFAGDIAYENLIALMEIVANYLKEERFSEILKDFSKKPYEQQRADCLKIVLKRKNILTVIKELFEKIRGEIEKDNADPDHQVDLDFGGIFTKVSHYLKHRLVRGKEWTVSQYFDWLRKILASLKGLNPEYADLTNPRHERREIVLEVYSEALEGRFRLVVRASGRALRICTFFFDEGREKKAKDGDMHVDGKKKKS